MEKGKKEVLEFLSSVFNVDFGEKNIGDLIWEAEHYYEVKASREYNHYSVIDFLTLYQIDCLYEKGLIVEKDRNNLIRLFYQKKDLFSRIGKRESDDEMLSDRIDQIDNGIKNGYSIKKPKYTSLTIYPNDSRIIVAETEKSIHVYNKNGEDVGFTSDLFMNEFKSESDHEKAEDYKKIKEGLIYNNGMLYWWCFWCKSRINKY